MESGLIKMQIRSRLGADHSSISVKAKIPPGRIMAQKLSQVQLRTLKTQLTSTADIQDPHSQMSVTALPRKSGWL